MDFASRRANDGPAAINVRCAMSADARREFLTRTTDLLLSKAPDRMRIDRPDTPIAAPSQGQPTQAQANDIEADDAAKPKPAAVSVSLSEITAAANPGARREPSIVDFWVEGRYEPYETEAGANNGELSAVYVGSNYKLGPDIMVGALGPVRSRRRVAGGCRGGRCRERLDVRTLHEREVRAWASFWTGARHGEHPRAASPACRSRRRRRIGGFSTES